MPNDGGILDPATQATGEPAPTAGPAPTPQPVPAMDAKALQDAIAPMFTQFGNQLLQHLEPRLQPVADPNAAPAPAANAPSDDMRLLDNPREFVQEQAQVAANAAVQTVVGPTMSAIAETQLEDRILRERQSFDAKFGNGKFDEHVEADLRSTLERLPVELRTSSSHITMVMNGIKGMKEDVLDTARAEHRSMQENDPPQMMGNGMPRPAAKGELTGDEKTFLADIARATGSETDPKDYAAWRDVGDTVEDVAELLAAEKAAENGVA